MLIGMAMKPEYFSKTINLFVALAPVARLTHASSKMLRFLSEQRELV